MHRTSADIYLAEVHEEIELLDKQVNVQKESLKTSKVHTSAPKPTAIKRKETNKNDCRIQKFLWWQEGFYKAVSEDWLNQFR